MLLLFVGMAFASQVSAQATGGTPHNWVAPQQAVDNLMNQVVNVLLPYYSQLDPNSVQGQDTYRHMLYYKTAAAEILASSSVPGGLDSALNGISVGPTGLKAIDGALTISKSQQMQLYSDAAALVSL